MINVVVLGLLFSDESLSQAYKYSKAGVQMAPHTFQKRMIEGIEINSDVNLKVINVPPIGSFLLNYKKLFIKSKKWNLNSYEVGYINFPIIKHRQQEKKIYRMLEKEFLVNKELHILIYSLYIPFLKAAIKLKKNYQDVKICLLQTDPIPGIGDHEKFMTVRKKKLGNKLLHLTKSIDSFIVLTKDLAEILEVGGRPWDIVECICNPSQANKAKEHSENICLYTGTTMEEYNIKDVVDAFKYIDNGQLWICGYGDCDEYIRNISKEYPNIRHFGMLKAEEVQQLRDKCDFLINPRRPTGTYTKYSFPSKTAEYLMSGKPSILYKLEGIPDEYNQYVNYIRGNDAKSIAEELKSLFLENYSNLIVKAERARNFMIEEKNPRIQGKKIVEIMKL